MISQKVAHPKTLVLTVGGGGIPVVFTPPLPGLEDLGAAVAVVGLGAVGFGTR